MNDGDALRDVVDFAVRTCPADGTERYSASWEVIAFLVGRRMLRPAFENEPHTLETMRARNRQALVDWLASERVPA